MLENAIGNSFPFGSVYVNAAATIKELTSTNKLNGLEKSMVYNGSSVGYCNKRFKSSKACCWLSAHGTAI